MLQYLIVACDDSKGEDDENRNPYFVIWVQTLNIYLGLNHMTDFCAAWMSNPIEF